MARMQRRRTESGFAAQTVAPPSQRTSVELSAAFVSPSPLTRTSHDLGHPCRASYDVPRPPRASLDSQRGARGTSLDVPRTPLAPFLPPHAPRQPSAHGSGVMGWLAAWGKLAEEQGCAVSPTPSGRQTASPSRPPHASPRPSMNGRASLAASSAFSSSSGPPRQPQDAPALQAGCLEPAATPPQQRQAWPSEPSSSNTSAGQSPQSRWGLWPPGHAPPSAAACCISPTVHCSITLVNVSLAGTSPWRAPVPLPPTMLQRSPPPFHR